MVVLFGGSRIERSFTKESKARCPSSQDEKGREKWHRLLFLIPAAKTLSTAYNSTKNQRVHRIEEYTCIESNTVHFGHVTTVDSPQ